MALVAIEGKLAQFELFWSVADVGIVGGVSARGGYLLGTLVPRWLGY